MHPIRPLVLLLALSSCAPSTLPRLQVAVAHGERSRVTGERREHIVWLRLSWGERQGRR